MDFEEKKKICSQIENCPVDITYKVYNIILKDNPNISLTQNKKSILLNFNKLEPSTIEKLKTLVEKYNSQNSIKIKEPINNKKDSEAFYNNTNVLSSSYIKLILDLVVPLSPKKK
jgi:hypothetical protein